MATWIDHLPTPDDPAHIAYLECPVCGALVPRNIFMPKRYCPGCGEPMTGPRPHEIHEKHRLERDQ